MSEKPNDGSADFLKSISLSRDDIEALDRLFQSVSPGELRDHLLEIYHTYLIHAHHSLPLDFEKLSLNLYLLISCLGTLENGTKK
jgi:hypothetical protein